MKMADRIACVVAVIVVLGTALAGCNKGSATSSAPQTPPAASTPQPSGAASFLGAARDQAKITAAKADMLNLKTALMTFQIDVGRWPTTQEGLGALLVRPAEPREWHGPYLDKLPVDPWGNAYVYRCPGKVNQDFDLFSCGPDGQAGDADDVWP